jgi:hypothetical protein
MDCLVAKPTKYLGNSGLSELIAVCMATTPPTKKEINATIPSEPIIRSSISRTISFLKTAPLVNFPKVFWSMRKYLPICSSNFIMLKNTEFKGLIP